MNIAYPVFDDAKDADDIDGRVLVVVVCSGPDAEVIDLIPEEVAEVEG